MFQPSVPLLFKINLCPQLMALLLLLWFITWCSGPCRPSAAFSLSMILPMHNQHLSVCDTLLLFKLQKRCVKLVQINPSVQLQTTARTCMENDIQCLQEWTVSTSPWKSSSFRKTGVKQSCHLEVWNPSQQWVAEDTSSIRREKTEAKRNSTKNRKHSI